MDRQKKAQALAGDLGDKQNASGKQLDHTTAAGSGKPIPAPRSRIKQTGAARTLPPLKKPAGWDRVRDKQFLFLTFCNELGISPDDRESLIRFNAVRLGQMRYGLCSPVAPWDDSECDPQ